MSNVVPFRGKSVSPEDKLSKKIAKSSMDLLLKEADLSAETSPKAKLTPSFKIIRIQQLLSPKIGKVGILNKYDEMHMLFINKTRLGRVYKASFGK